MQYLFPFSFYYDNPILEINQQKKEEIPILVAFLTE